jgi:hypothetical protein
MFRSFQSTIIDLLSKIIINQCIMFGCCVCVCVCVFVN